MIKAAQPLPRWGQSFSAVGWVGGGATGCGLLLAGGATGCCGLFVFGGLSVVCGGTPVVCVCGVPDVGGGVPGVGGGLSVVCCCFGGVGGVLSSFLAARFVVLDSVL